MVRQSDTSAIRTMLRTWGFREGLLLHDMLFWLGSSACRAQESSPHPTQAQYRIPSFLLAVWSGLRPDYLQVQPTCEKQL